MYPTKTVAKMIEVEELEQVEVDIEDNNKEETEKKTKKEKKKIHTHVDPNEKKEKNMNLFKVDDTYINTWSTYFRQHARVAPYLSSNTANDLEKAFKFSNVKETSVQAFV